MSRGYDNPRFFPYVYPALAFGGASSSTTILPPPGLSQGYILDIHAAVTVLFTAVTTPAFVRVGYSGNNAYYAELSMGVAAASAGYNRRSATLTPATPRKIDMNNDPTTGVLTSLLVNFVAATGGSPAGTATVTIGIEWF